MIVLLKLDLFMRYPIKFSISFKRNILPGILVALEGIDGSGKTTQALELVKRLKKDGYKVVYTKEPTDEPTGKLIRQVLSGEIKVPPLSLQYLFCADRGVHQWELEKYLQKGYIVVTDRYFWSAVAYGISDLKGTPDYYLVAFSILSMYNQFMKPDFTFFLDVDVEEAFRRISQSSKHGEIYDKKGKLVKIKDAYAQLFKKFNGEFVMVDGNQSIDTVQNDLLENVKKMIIRKYLK